MTPAVAGVVLAAGAGRRMGRPKGLLALQDRPLLQLACDALQAGGCSPVAVVVGASGEEVADLAPPGVAIVVNEAWETGMASSVRRGLAWAADIRPAAGAVVVLPVDTPGLGPDVVRHLIGRWAVGDRTAAAVATYGGRPRNPVLLPADVWGDVAARVQGDTGARDWLRSNPGRTIEVDCTGHGDPADLDTPHDLARWSGQPDVPAAAGPSGEAHGT